MHTLNVYHHECNNDGDPIIPVDSDSPIDELIVDFETEMLSTIHSLLYQNYVWIMSNEFDIFIDDIYQDQYEGVKKYVY